MEYGIVYLLTNPYMPGLVKIGMTKQEDLEKINLAFDHAKIIKDCLKSIIILILILKKNIYLNNLK